MPGCIWFSHVRNTWLACFHNSRGEWVHDMAITPREARLCVDMHYVVLDAI